MSHCENKQFCSRLLPLLTYFTHTLLFFMFLYVFDIEYNSCICSSESDSLVFSLNQISFSILKWLMGKCSKPYLPNTNTYVVHMSNNILEIDVVMSPSAAVYVRVPMADPCCAREVELPSGQPWLHIIVWGKWHKNRANRETKVTGDYPTGVCISSRKSIVLWSITVKPLI